ncbi:MAG TPA: FtsL-like putative cell division protein [Saprospiraceae bacterium]|nr:FtsL-like putative cell division protein [Saprospiraceae bacterium]HMP14713.1 FtsL-like putative cell division protein [Saprospiraceae bacterium]
MAKKRGISKYLELSYWSEDLILKNLPFVLFLGFLALIYIANAHFAERNVRRIQTLQKEIKELRWHHRSLQADIMFRSKRSQMQQKVKDQGLRPWRTEPKRIVISK